ncbi:MAG TPA: AAA family ATPase [Acidimicrobiales bacterium]|jgi:magnesium chelatase subunit D|nr:AAA family ATPase [Acidimicrobiales bacterium]
MTPFPFSAVVGQDDVKLALLLAAIDPALGGVLLRGEKGSAKTTVARGLAALLPAGAPFVELPVGATEDRLIGTLDLAAALTAGERRFQPGLLAAAHGGVLYVDEVNLLPDHLVDVLLDVAASGVNLVEREGVSHRHPARFVLVGSMNPEEGDLRPQLLDRFGLAVDVRAPLDPAVRAEAVRRRLAFDHVSAGASGRPPQEWVSADEALAARLAAARPASLPDELVEQVSRLCAGVGAQGLRADLTICRAAAAVAGFEGRDCATVEDVRRVAPLALGHRRRQNPFDSPGISDEELDDALERAADEAPAHDAFERDAEEGAGGAGQAAGQQTHVVAPDAARPVVPLAAGRPAGPAPLAAPGRRSTVEGPRGRLVADRVPDGPIESLAVGATVRAAAARRSLPGAEPAPLVPADLRQAVRQQRAGNLVILAVDASGSMGAGRRMEAAKGAVLSLLLDAYQRRDKVALVTFRGDGADVVLKPTSSVEVARARLTELPTGGRTPLAAGIGAALDVATAAGGPSAAHRPLLVLVTDGRATAAGLGAGAGLDEDPLAAALAAADAVRRRRVSAVVVDAEDGPTRLGLARSLAEAMGARYLTLPELTAGALDAAVRAVGRG